jgi:hypothetical protein
MGHVILGHRMDSNFAFFDQLLVEDKETFRHFGFARTPAEEEAANKKGAELLATALKDPQVAKSWKMENASLFFHALETRQKEIPNLISAHLGDRVPTIADVKTAATPDPKENSQMVAALPIGGRVKLDPWNDKLELIKSKPVGTIAEREKMPFEVTPFMPYLTRFGAEAGKPIAASAATPGEAKPGETPQKPNQ